MEQQQPSQLFTLRIWPELDEEGQLRWRGKLRHVQSNTTLYFRDWAALVPLLLSVLRQQPLSGYETPFSSEKS